MAGGTAAPDGPEAVAPDRVIPLFNGKDLDGLHTWLVDTQREDPRRVFTVRDGMIHITGDGFGYLSTDKAYRDYRLVVEFKWGERDWRGREGKAKDSGIFLHARGPDGNSYDGHGAYKAAIECQVMQGCVGDLLLINGKDHDGSWVPVRLTAEATKHRDEGGWAYWSRGGRTTKYERGGRLNWFGKDRAWRDVLGFRGKDDVESPADEWTRVECVCNGNRVTVIVNDTVVNEAYDVYPNSGPILLQCEGSEVFFRRFELHPLEPSGSQTGQAGDGRGG